MAREIEDRDMEEDLRQNDKPAGRGTGRRFFKTAPAAMKKKEIQALKDYNDRLVKERLTKEMEIDAFKDKLEEQKKELSEELQIKQQQSLVFKEDFERERKDRERIHTELERTKALLLESKKECDTLKQLLLRNTDSYQQQQSCHITEAKIAELRGRFEYEQQEREKITTKKLADLNDLVKEQRHTIDGQQQTIGEYQQTIDKYQQTIARLERDNTWLRKLTDQPDEYDGASNREESIPDKKDKNRFSSIHEPPIFRNEDELRKTLRGYDNHGRGVNIPPGQKQGLKLSYSYY